MIPAIQEINFPSYATLHQATASFTEMGERTISTQVRIDGDVVPDFEGWELSFKGERFILNTKDPQAVKDNTTRNSLVDLTFVSWPINELKRYFFFEAASVGAGTAIADKYKAPVNLNVEDFAVLFNQVLNHYFGGKIVFSLYMSGQGQYSTDRALVEINYTYIWDVLVKFFEVYGVRWRIEYNGTTDVYTIKAGWPDASIDDHDFEYGYKGGLLRFERQVQDVDIHNILLGRGGEKNLPYRYFKRVDPQNPDWAADPDAIPELANISFDRLRDINFRWYVRGWMQNPNHDTSWEEGGYVYPTYSSVPAQYQFAYDKGRTDERFNPVEYVRDLPSIEAYGEHWGALDDNDEVFPTIQGVTREPFGRIDETVAVSEIVTDDISAMAQNAAVEKSINRMSVSLYGNTRTEFELLSEEFTIPEGSTGNISYAPFGTDDIYPNLVRFDTENSTLVAVSGDTEYPISAIPAGTYRLKLNMVIARSGQATSATGTYGIENIVLTTSSQDADAWKPTFDIWVKNIWNTAPQQGESDAQYAERVWLPILGDRAGNEAKIVFSSGFMSVSEDYEFTIASYPVRDTSKSINGVPSEWRITLRKSDAEFDATGLYIPNASTGGKPVAGDKFFFIGIDMPHMYVTLAEEDLNTYKAAQLDTEAAVSPTWIMNLDKVRVNTLEDDEYGQTLADRLAAGTKVWITDPRFTPGRKLQLYIQSITYTWNEPTDESPYIVPDIEVVLSDKVVATESVVQRIQNDVSAIKQQYARISDVEAVVRSVAEPIFLKKTGESDSSDSPTQFSSKVTSKGFRQGGIGGKGWGIYRDNTSDFAEGEEGEGDTVIEVDRIVARKELQVNSLVVNQIAYRGGMEVISAAKIEVSKVIETDTEYICYFDQRRNSVANSFVVGDIAMGMIFNAANTAVERYYKAIVTAIDIDCIHLSKTQKVGAGAPAVGDTIIQYGNPTNTARQYVIVRDVIGGGYERMISGLNSLNTDGDEYYFAGKQSSESGPRWFVGSHADNGDYAEYINGVLTIKANVIFKAGQIIPGIADLTDDVEALEYLKTALPKSDTIITGGLILSKVIALRDANNAVMSGINGDPSLSNIAAWYGGPMADKEASPTPASYAKSLFRFDGSGYLAGGNIHWDNQGYGGIPGITWSNDGTNDIVTIGANVRLASVDGDTVTDLLNAVNSIKDWFEIVDGNIHVKNNRGFYSDSFISAGGISPGGGTGGIDLAAMWASLQNNDIVDTYDSYQFAAAHLPTCGSGLSYTISNGIATGINVSFPVTSVAGKTGAVTLAFSDITGTASTAQIPDLSGTYLPRSGGSSYPMTGDLYMGGKWMYGLAAINGTMYFDRTNYRVGINTQAPQYYLDVADGVRCYSASFEGQLIIERGSGADAVIVYKNINGYLGNIGVHSTGYPYFSPNHGTNNYALYHQGNSNLSTVDWTANQMIANSFKLASSGTQILTWDANANAWHLSGNFYADGFISAGGLSPGGGASGIDLAAMWASLTNNPADAYASTKIAAAHIPDMASTYGYLKSADAVADVALNGDYLRVTKNGANTDLTIPYATTARYVIGDNNASSPQYALLQSGGGRQDASPEGDTWLFCDTLGGATSPWGIRHNQGNNTIGFIGAGTERILLDMETGAITGASFVKSGGTSSQFLKADGSVDSSAYITGITSTMVTTALGYTPANSTSLANFVTLGTEQTITGRKIFTSPSSIVIQLPNNEVNNYTEGIRFNLGGGDAWAGFTIGGTQVTGTGLGIWAFLVNSSDFYIGHNGSSNATYGLSWTASGALNLKTSSLTSNGSTIWTAANDGATSGLDADLLDGQHGSYYAAASSLANYVTLASGQIITGLKVFQSRVSGEWSYLRLDNTSAVWDLATVNSTAGMLGVANTFEIRDGGSNYGLAVRYGTSAYGRVVIVSPSGESSLGFWSNEDNPAPGYPIWVCGYTADSNKTFGWYNTNSSSDQGWRMLLGTDGHLAIGGAPYTPSYVLNAAGSGNFSASLNVGTSLTVGQTIRAGNGYSIAVGTPGAAGSSYYANYISAGPGYSANSGRYGVKILVCDQSDAQTGLGQDVVSPTGWSNEYNLCVIGGNSPYADYGYISFTTHIANSNSYRYLGGFRDNAGAVTFQVIGNIVATGAITAGSASDARLKTNIQSLSAEAAKRIVMALNPVTFTWNSTATELYDQYKGNDLGFIAQEVEPYLPQAIGTIFEKYMRLDQTKVIAPLVAVAQDHETRIRQLERENAELKRRLNMN